MVRILTVFALLFQLNLKAQGNDVKTKWYNGVSLDLTYQPVGFVYEKEFLRESGYASHKSFIYNHAAEVGVSYLFGRRFILGAGLRFSSTKYSHYWSNDVLNISDDWVGALVWTNGETKNLSLGPYITQSFKIITKGKYAFAIYSRVLLEYPRFLKSVQTAEYITEVEDGFRTATEIRDASTEWYAHKGRAFMSWQAGVLNSFKISEAFRLSIGLNFSYGNSVFAFTSYNSSGKSRKKIEMNTPVSLSYVF